MPTAGHADFIFDYNYSKIGVEPNKISKVNF